MTMPSFGTRTLDPIAIDDVLRLLDREALFAGRWQFRQGMDSAAWEALKASTVEPLLARLLLQARTRGTFAPRIVYGFFRCERESNGLIVHGEHQALRFDFPRERQEPHRCLADFFPEGFIAMQIATVGEGPVEAAAAEFAKHRYSEAFYLKGLAAELAEATAAFGHAHIRTELGAAPDAGARFSPGYPSFPDLLAQRKIAALLGFRRIGVALTETCQLVPEYSTSAIVSIDPSATHFRP
jgi:5-methyltetrahydrofolate--homocysteine methyltransferase